MTARTIRRFTISVLAAYVATILMVINNHHHYTELYGYIVTGVFAFPFAMAVDLFMESKKVGGFGRWFSRVVVLGLIGAAYFYIFRNLQERFGTDGLRSVLMFSAAAILVFFAPFFCRGKGNAFWQFSVSLIGRIFQALFYFGILFLGIVLLIESVNYLFKFNLGGEYIGDAWFVITGILVSMFFLSGVPHNFKSLDRTTAYPKFLRVLTEYFLVPLVFLYLLVLYVYSGKILFTWQWPMGGVASWIMGFSMVGVLTYFFIFSVKEKFPSHVEFFKKWFFVLLLPLLLVLALSISMRIQNYGVTQDRYFVVAFGVWALVMAVFYIISESKNLKFMAVSLFVIIVAMLYGPQSVFDLPKTSQTVRLEKLLVQNGILVNGKVVKADVTKLNSADVYSVDSTLSYVVENYGTDSLQPWFSQNLADIKTNYEYDYWTKVQAIEGYMGVEMSKFAYPYGYPPTEGPYNVNLVAEQDCNKDVVKWKPPYPLGCMVNISGYSYFGDIGINAEAGSEPSKTLVNGKQYVFVFEGPMLIFKEIAPDGIELFRTDLSSMYNALVAKYPTGSVPISEMTINFSQGSFRIHDLNLNYENKQFKAVQFVGGYLLLY